MYNIWVKIYTNIQYLFRIVGTSKCRPFYLFGDIRRTEIWSYRKTWVLRQATCGHSTPVSLVNAPPHTAAAEAGIQTAWWQSVYLQWALWMRQSTQRPQRQAYRLPGKKRFPVAEAFRFIKVQHGIHSTVLQNNILKIKYLQGMKLFNIR